MHWNTLGGILEPHPSLTGINSRQETDMRELAIFISVFVAIFMSFLPIMLSGREWAAAQDKARLRRLANARMNARLLRLNL